jgi:hypothetical protein
MVRNMGLTPREQKVLRAIERRRRSLTVDWIAVVVAAALGLGVAVGLGVISKYVLG